MSMNKSVYLDYVGLEPVTPFVMEHSLGRENGDSEKNAILTMIYDFNPITGLPSDDVGMYLNKNVSPEVLAFIRENLMQDLSGFAAPGVPAGVDDDTILALQREINESRDSYVKRVREFLDSEKMSINAQRDLLERAKVADTPTSE